MNNPELLKDRAVLAISGPDAKTFLQGVVTQDIQRLQAGKPVFSCLLTPQGKILFEFLIFESDDALLIDVFADHAEALVKRLKLYRLRAKVEIELRGDLSVYAIDGAPDFAGVAAEDPRLAALGARGVGDAGQGALGGGYEARRIDAGVPELGRDFQPDELFLLDVNYDLLGGVSYKKGCFVGQEVTSRMKRKGEVRKRTLVGSFNGAAPAKGAPVTAGDSTLGHIMSAGGGAALALIRLDRWAAAKAAETPAMADGTELTLTVPAYLQSD